MFKPMTIFFTENQSKKIKENVQFISSVNTAMRPEGCIIIRDALTAFFFFQIEYEYVFSVMFDTEMSNLLSMNQSGMSWNILFSSLPLNCCKQ